MMTSSAIESVNSSRLLWTGGGLGVAIARSSLGVAFLAGVALLLIVAVTLDLRSRHAYRTADVARHPSAELSLNAA